MGANSGAERDCTALGGFGMIQTLPMFNPWRREHKERKPILSVEHPSAWLGPSEWKQLACGMLLKQREGCEQSRAGFRGKCVLTLIFVHKEHKLGLQMVPCRHNDPLQ